MLLEANPNEEADIVGVPMIRDEGLVGIELLDTLHILSIELEAKDIEVLCHTLPPYTLRDEDNAPLQ